MRKSRKQKYMVRKRVFLDGIRYCIYRRLPEWEYMGYYTGRKAEIHVDRKGVHWLHLNDMQSARQAERYLKKLDGSTRCAEYL